MTRKCIKMVILIFDSSRQITERLIELISETVKDITFHKAVSYEEAINLLQICTPDAVLLDFKFPCNCIIELLKKVKTSNDKTVVIGLLSMANEPSRKQFTVYGADFIFDKYDDFEELPGVINAIR